jgi:hypothetical protein
MSSVISTINSCNTALTHPNTFEGVYEFVGGFTTISIATSTISLIPDSITLEIIQSFDGVNPTLAESIVYNVNEENIKQLNLIYRYVKVRAFANSVFNLGTLIVSTRYSTVLLTPIDFTGNVAITGNVSIATNAQLTAINNNLSNINSNIVVCNTSNILGSVAVSSQPHLSYLTDNVAVATIPAITGTVAVSSQPHLSYLTDNVAVATMPAITGTVAVSSQPHLSYLTDNVAVATQPALTFSTDKVDVSGSSVIVSSMPTTVAYRTTSAGNTGLVIKASAGIVARIYISNYDTTNQAFLYVRLYDKATAATDADTPLCCFDLPHRGNSGADSRIMLDLDNLAFTNGLGIRATTGSNANNDVVVSNLASDITVLYK